MERNLSREEGYEQPAGAVQLGPLCRGQVKGGQAHALADPVAQVGVEEERHASHACNASVTSPRGQLTSCPPGQPSRTQVPVSEVGPLLCVDLRVGVQVPHPLDVHHDQLVARTLEGEVAEGLKGAGRR